MRRYDNPMGTQEGEGGAWDEEWGGSGGGSESGVECCWKQYAFLCAQCAQYPHTDTHTMHCTGIGYTQIKSVPSFLFAQFISDLPCDAKFFDVRYSIRRGLVDVYWIHIFF